MIGTSIMEIHFVPWQGIRSVCWQGGCTDVANSNVRPIEFKVHKTARFTVHTESSFQFGLSHL